MRRAACDFIHVHLESERDAYLSISKQGDVKPRSTAYNLLNQIPLVVSLYVPRLS